MSGENDLTIRLRALDGQWETVGADRLRGIVPESFQATANEWGSDTCSFVLRRQTGAVHPDLTAFTPCRVDVAGVKVWSGRVKETPEQDGVDEAINVQGEGMQYHLDDDVYSAIYVHTRMEDYRDARSYVTADLTRLTAAPTVEATSGAITMGWGEGSTISGTGGTAAVVGVILDLGESRANYVATDFKFIGPAGAQTLNFLVRGTDDPAVLFAGSGDFDAIASQTFSGGLEFSVSGAATNRRYVGLFLAWAGGAASTNITTQFAVQVTSARVFGASAYQTSDLSNLTADDVVSDAITQGTALLSSDRSQIAAGTFTIEEYAPTGAQSPREVIAGINAYENYDTKIDVEDRPYFQPRPVAPIYELGEWAGADFADASANSGDDIYNRVIVQGVGPDGVQMSVPRSAADQSTATLTPVSSPSVTNPSFTVDTSSWSSATVTLSRTTTAGEFDSSPGALKMVVTSSGGRVTGLISGTFTKGVTYTLRARGRINTGASKPNMYMQLGVDGTDAAKAYGMSTSVLFQDMSVSWTPSATRTSGVTVIISFTGQSTPAGTYFIDSLALFVNGSTLVDRRSFRRTKILPVATAITAATGSRIGDLFLSQHRTTPFRGGFKVTGRGGVRKVLGGGGVHPAWLLRDTGQLIRCAHRADPDTGAWTRVGRMATVTYDHDSQTSTVALDEDREGFEALLARLALVTG